MLYPPLTPLRCGVFYFPQVDSCPAQQPEGHHFLDYLVLSCKGDSENFSKYVYMYILIQSGDIYGYGEGDDSQIRVAPPRNNTHTIAFTVSVSS